MMEMKREEALALIKSKVSNPNLIKHMLATEACMRILAHHFKDDEELWGLAGLLHDLDYDETVDDFSQHGLITATILHDLKMDEAIIYAIKTHPGWVKARSKMDKALYAVDPLTGLIVASALMHPSKSFSVLGVQFILNRFREKRFAARANRDQIQSCTDLGLSLEEFTALCLKAMQGISQQLGL